MRVGLVEQAGTAVLGGQACHVLQYARQPPGGVSGARRVHHADAIGLVFGILVESPCHDFRAIADQVLHHRVTALRLAAGSLSQRTDQAGLLQHLEMMLLGDMGDFMPQHPGQIGLVVEQTIQALGHKNIAPRRCKGIDILGVEHAETPGDVLAPALQRHPVANQVDIILQLVVAHQLHRTQQVAGNLAADAVFLLQRVLAEQGKAQLRRVDFLPGRRRRRGGALGCLRCLFRGLGRFRLWRLVLVQLLLNPIFKKLAQIERGCPSAERNQRNGQ